MENFILGFGAISLLATFFFLEMILAMVGASIYKSIEILDNFKGWIIGLVIGNLIFGSIMLAIYILGYFVNSVLG